MVYTVVGTDALGCESSTLIPVLTNTLPILGVTPSNATVCSKSNATLVAIGAGSYTWSAGASNGATVVVTPTVNTTYTVFGASTTNGCVGSKTVAVTTKTLPVITISPSSPSVCVGSLLTLTASGPANTYTWSTGDLANSTVVSPIVATTYTVTGKVIQGCAGTQTILVGVNQLPLITLSPASPTICTKETDVITLTGASSYTLFPGNTVGSGSFTVSPNNTTTYSVTGVDANGCVNTNSTSITVSKCTGIAQNSAVSDFISVFPNPSTGLITTQFGFEGVKEIVIVNSVGALITSSTTESNTESFDLSNFAKGIYFVRISTKGTTNNYKIVIQ